MCVRTSKPNPFGPDRRPMPGAMATARRPSSVSRSARARHAQSSPASSGSIRDGVRAPVPETPTRDAVQGNLNEGPAFGRPHVSAKRRPKGDRHNAFNVVLKVL
jgi:hypothetical protein